MCVQNKKLSIVNLCITQYSNVNTKRTESFQLRSSSISQGNDGKKKTLFCDLCYFL
jgi:hypothetical protein